MASRRSAERAASARVAPSRARATASARPMPELAPVTSATLPAREVCHARSPGCLRVRGDDCATARRCRARSAPALRTRCGRARRRGRRRRASSRRGAGRRRPGGRRTRRSPSSSQPSAKGSVVGGAVRGEGGDHHPGADRRRCGSTSRAGPRRSRRGTPAGTSRRCRTSCRGRRRGRPSRPPGRRRRPAGRCPCTRWCGRGRRRTRGSRSAGPGAVWWLISPGGMSSPMRSTWLSVNQSSPVSGSKSWPTELRMPRV